MEERSVMLKNVTISNAKIISRQSRKKMEEIHFKIYLIWILNRSESNLKWKLEKVRNNLEGKCITKHKIIKRRATIILMILKERKNWPRKQLKRSWLKLKTTSRLKNRCKNPARKRKASKGRKCKVKIKWNEAKDY